LQHVVVGFFAPFNAKKMTNEFNQNAETIADFKAYGDFRANVQNRKIALDFLMHVIQYYDFENGFFISKKQRTSPKKTHYGKLQVWNNFLKTQK
jgi:hypothetical protein